MDWDNEYRKEKGKSANLSWAILVFFSPFRRFLLPFIIRNLSTWLVGQALASKLVAKKSWPLFSFLLDPL